MKMQERPILFSGPMVRAILDGRKTQTRRPITIAHAKKLGLDYCGTQLLSADGPAWNGEFEGGAIPWTPFGQPGDRLWVRETWRPYWHQDHMCCVQYRADATFRKPVIDDSHYRGPRFAEMCEQSKDADEPWHSPLHMMREASRLTLEVVGVRVERVQDIGKDGRKAHDVLAEGVDPEAIARNRAWFHPDDSPALAFAGLWDNINGKGEFRWAANPWVWVVEFRRVSP